MSSRIIGTIILANNLIFIVILNIKTTKSQLAENVPYVSIETYEIF